jgi:hypothetical protein
MKMNITINPDNVFFYEDEDKDGSYIIELIEGDNHIDIRLNEDVVGLLFKKIKTLRVK